MCVYIYISDVWLFMKSEKNYNKKQGHWKKKNFWFLKITQLV